MKGDDCFMNNEKMIKILGIVATVAGMSATLLTNWVDDKKMDEKIIKKINEALANREK